MAEPLDRAAMDRRSGCRRRCTECRRWFAAAASTLFNLIDRRHGKASTAFSSNIPLSAWGKYHGDATLAVAILDSVAMRAVRLDIDGPSYRQQVARDRAKARGGKFPDDGAELDPEREQ